MVRLLARIACLAPLALAAVFAPTTASAQAVPAPQPLQAPPTLGPGPLTLEEVLAALDDRNPAIGGAKQEFAAAKGEALAADGAFDPKWKTKAEWEAVGYYRNVIVDTSIEQPTRFRGVTLFGGYRIGQGKFPVYDYKYFIGDTFDPMSFGTVYDPNKKPLEQLFEMRKVFPMPSFLNRDPASVNSEYSNGGRNTNNAYFSSGCFESEDIWYTAFASKSREILDSQELSAYDMVYKALFSDHLYKSAYIYFSDNCSTSYFLYDCRNCTDCFGCIKFLGRICFRKRKMEQ